MFGIGLGHQMLALSEDFKIEKMPQGTAAQISL